jgi:hypothetical protein
MVLVIDDGVAVTRGNGNRWIDPRFEGEKSPRRLKDRGCDEFMQRQMNPVIRLQIFIEKAEIYVTPGLKLFYGLPDLCVKPSSQQFRM